MNSYTNKPLLGISCILTGMLSMTLMDAAIKSLSDSYPLHEIVFVRSIVAIALTFFIIRMEGGLHLLRTRRPFLHLARGILIVIANMAFYLALSVMPLAEATGLFFISPLLITAFSVMFLGEQVGWRSWLAIVIGFTGIAVMMRLGTDSFTVYSLLPVLAALTYAITQIITRWISVTEKASVMSFYISAVFIVISAGFWVMAGDGSYAGVGGPGLDFLFRSWSMPDQTDAAVMLFIGLLVTIVGYMLSQAYRVAEVNIIAPFEYIALPLAVLWGYLFWREAPDLYSAVGILLVGSSGIYVFFREHRSSAPVDQSYGIKYQNNEEN